MKLAAAILAGGVGRRFGGDKLLQPLCGRPLITYALDSAAASPVEELFLLAGSTAVAERGREWAADRSAPLRLIPVATAVEGIAGSLREAASAARERYDGLYVFLGDMPFVPASLADRLAGVVAQGASAAAPVFKGRRGHPVLLGAGLIEPLLMLRGDRGAVDLLGGAALIEVDHDGVLFDVDTPAALAKAEQRLGQQQRPLPPL